MDGTDLNQSRLGAPVFVRTTKVIYKQMIWYCEGCHEARWREAKPEKPLPCEVVRACEACFAKELKEHTYDYRS